MKQLSELVKEKVVSEEVAKDILYYYQSKKGESSNKILIVFGVLGALFVGLGIILILAHNWDEIPRGVKVIFAFLPLIIGQLGCAYTLIKRPESKALRESLTVFLILAIGSSISLVGQIYNIPGSITSFLLTWMLLSLPLVYFMKSSVGSMIYIAGITYYAVETGYWDYNGTGVNLYWILLLGILPHYLILLKNKQESMATVFHQWLIPISVIITLGTISGGHEELLVTTYLSLFGLFYVLGDLEFFSNGKLRNNSFKVLGSTGQLILLLVLSFGDFTRHISRFKDNWFESTEVYVALIISIIAIVMLVFQRKGRQMKTFNPLTLTFILAIVLYFMGMTTEFATLLVNLLILAIGVFTIRKGAKQDHLGILNYGLFIVTILIISRFFDADILFIVKGLLFILLGFGFFFANYLTIKKRKANVKK